MKASEKASQLRRIRHCRRSRSFVCWSRSWHGAGSHRPCASTIAELLADRFVTSCADRSIELRYIQPGKPAQNGFIERLNWTYRTEVLSAYVFEPLAQVREINAEWLQSYNEERPHDALTGLPPAIYRTQLEAKTSPFEASR